MPITTEITVQAGSFTAAVAWVGKWVAGKPVVPVHGGISLTLPRFGDLVIGAFSENATAQAVMSCEYPEDPEPVVQHAIVSGRLLTELAGTLGKQDVVLTGSDDGRAVVLTSGRFVATLPTLPEADYPALPGAMPAIGTVPGAALARALEQVAGAAGRGKSPAWLNTVYADFVAEGSIILMATDRFRMARVVLPWKPDGGIIVTPDAAVLAEAAAGFDGPDDVTIGSNGSLLSLTSPTRSLTIGTVPIRDAEGNLVWPAAVLAPQFDRLPEQRITIDRGALTLPLKRARIMRGKDGPVRVTIADGTLTLGAAEETTKRTSDDEVPVDYDGPAFSTGYDPDFIGEALHSAPGNTVHLHFGDPQRPAVITCDTDPSWRHVLMPIRLR
jgi:DNA polymerase-3 subunit beta